MFRSFTTHLKVNEEDWILHFNFDCDRLRYLVKVLNRRDKEACTMAMISHYYWKIIQGVDADLKAEEHKLNDLIRQYNQYSYV